MNWIKKYRKDIYNVIVGALAIGFSLLLIETIHIKHKNVNYYVIAYLIPLLLAIVGFHYIYKSIRYHWKCYQWKNRESIRKYYNRNEKCK